MINQFVQITSNSHLLAKLKTIPFQNILSYELFNCLQKRRGFSIHRNFFLCIFHDNCLPHGLSIILFLLKREYRYNFGHVQTLQFT